VNILYISLIGNTVFTDIIFRVNLTNEFQVKLTTEFWIKLTKLKYEF